MRNTSVLSSTTTLTLLTGLLATLFISGCTSWPSEGKGGWAEVYPPKHVQVADTWYWQRQAVLWREFEHQKLLLDNLVSQGIKFCMPGQLHQAELMRNRVQRELVAELHADAEQDLLILSHQLAALQRNFNQVARQTHCVRYAMMEQVTFHQDNQHQLVADNQPNAANRQTQLGMFTLIKRIEELLNADNQFAFDQHQITPKYQTRVLQASQLLAELSDYELLLVGHTDTQGESGDNYQLGLQRADQVKQALVALGINPYHVITTTQGELTPYSFAEQQAGITASSRHHSDRRVQAFIRWRGEVSQINPPKANLPSVSDIGTTTDASHHVHSVGHDHHLADKGFHKQPVLLKHWYLIQPKTFKNNQQ